MDTPSALEFQREILEQISESELQAIASDLDLKCAALQEALSGEGQSLDRAELRKVLRALFATRRRTDEILDSLGPQLLADAIGRLLADDEPVADRIDRFDATMREHDANGALRGSGFDLPIELLHFTAPERYWLWTRWIWDPLTSTGALALLVADDADLRAGTTRGDVYLRVGRAMAIVDETGRAARFIVAKSSLFGVDVLLAAVYGVYMHTVLEMRLTREFNRVIPPLPDLIRRLLGVYHLGA